jgi:hypothetical protein
MSGLPVSTLPAVEPIRKFDAQSYSQALESWGWLKGLAGMSPALANAFGDLFMEAADGSYAFLSTLDGTLERHWPDAASLQAAINTRQAQDEFLIVGLVQDASRAGLDPGPQQVLSFKVPPALGGAVAVENLTVEDFVVTVNIAGQIHQQIRELPPGATISGVTID